MLRGATAYVVVPQQLCKGNWMQLHRALEAQIQVLNLSREYKFKPFGDGGVGRLVYKGVDAELFQEKGFM